jgi:2-iminobutanoate/2-iminopropanoate deaminase
MSLTNHQPRVLAFLLAILFFQTSCQPAEATKETATEPSGAAVAAEVPETIEYFSLRPETEKAYGYTHAVRIGNDIKVSGAVSMDDAGVPTAKGDLLQQMKNCYADLDKVLKHYGCTFDDVVVENVFTTNMPEFLKQSGYRNSIYTKQFPTGSWLGVKELALPEFLIEIELEVHKSK